jgi:hypothetical protein
LTGSIKLDTVLQAVAGRFTGPIADANIASAKVAFQWVIDHRDDGDFGAGKLGGPDAITDAIAAIGESLGIPDPRAPKPAEDKGI